MLRFLAVVCLAVFCFAGLPISAQSDAEPLPAELDAQLESLVSVAEAIRGLATLNPVERAFPTREETIAYLTRLFNADLPPEELARLELFYRVLGLLPEDVDLAQAYLTLLGAQVGGFYDSDTQIMNVIPMLGETPGESLSITEQAIFIHEYVHALQDQHFGLDSLEQPDVEAVPDRSLALTALVEGDASAAMQVYLQEVLSRNPLAALSILAEGALSNTLTLPPDTPAVLGRELLFPYETGLNFVVAIADDGGWDAVDAAYANPPETTEQVLHPEKYEAGEAAVTRPEWDAAHAFEAEGWTQRWNVPLGEYYLREHLMTLMNTGDAGTAAAGWGGDLFTVYEREDGARLWLLTSAWDTPEDSAEFLTLYRAGLETAFGAPLSEDDRCFAAPSGAACAFALANGDTRLVYAPTLDLAQAFLEQ